MNVLVQVLLLLALPFSSIARVTSERTIVASKSPRRELGLWSWWQSHFWRGANVPLGSAIDCVSTDFCPGEQYCMAGKCHDFGDCANDRDCYNPSNVFAAVACVGPLYCTKEGRCGRNCTGSTCKENLPWVECFAAPCEVSLCSEAVSCVDDYCGGCNALHFDAAGNQVCRSCVSDANCTSGEYCKAGECRRHGSCTVDVDCLNPSNIFASIDCVGPLYCTHDGTCGRNCTGSLCNEGVDFVNCFAAPCQVASCPEAISCVDNYCGGCNAILFDAAGNHVCN